MKQWDKITSRIFTGQPYRQDLSGGATNRHRRCLKEGMKKGPTVMAMAISYNWLFLWDYTFYKWGYKYL